MKSDIWSTSNEVFLSWTICSRSQQQCLFIWRQNISFLFAFLQSVGTSCHKPSTLQLHSTSLILLTNHSLTHAAHCSLQQFLMIQTSSSFIRQEQHRKKKQNKKAKVNNNTEPKSQWGCYSSGLFTWDNAGCQRGSKDWAKRIMKCKVLRGWWWGGGQREAKCKRIS